MSLPRKGCAPTKGGTLGRLLVLGHLGSIFNSLIDSYWWERQWEVAKSIQGFVSDRPGFAS